MSDAARTKKTLIFCTAYVGPSARPSQSWEGRYKRWLRAIQSSKLHRDQILIVDDGSPTLPEWPGVTTLSFLPTSQPAEPVVLFHFRENLGRPAVYDYPGWFRSYVFAATYAQSYGFEKIIHVESDAYLISSRMQEYCNEVDDDWVTFLGPRHDYPETGIQVIAGKGLPSYYKVAVQPYEDFAGKPIEVMLPFTKVERRFLGDRFGEYLTYVPQEADWTMQTYMPAAESDRYYWWLPGNPVHGEGHMYRKKLGAEFRHSGVPYAELLPKMAAGLSCRTFFEIGTENGSALKAIKCDSVSVDPTFRVSHDVLQGRRRAHFFQMTSDVFFEHYNLNAFFPGGIDLAFLNGFHRFEALLRDFISTERFCHEGSVILFHNCLPLNERMAERTFRIAEEEDPSTRDYWTGDMWRLLPILERYRPDLRIQVFDCGPTGLVACTRVERYSRILSTNYDAIVEEYSKLDLSAFGLRRLWSMFPTLDSRELTQLPFEFAAALFGEPSDPNTAP